jgi:RNA polymerase sigma factor (TIGR02999 family)
MGGTPQERRVLDDLMNATYEELRRLAFSVSRQDGAATLNPTALVNEAWVKLAKSPSFVTTSRLHFKRVAGKAMRQILIESARRRHAQKRGGAAVFVTFDQSAEDAAVSDGEDFLALMTALDELASVAPRQANLIECRFFGGMDLDETAEELGFSKETLTRDWRAAKAWLKRAVRKNA